MEQNCTRSWQVEAFEDKRLDEKERNSFERHLKGCTICREEVRTLSVIREQMSHADNFSARELEHQRARLRLLKAADHQLLKRENRSTTNLNWVKWAVVVPAVLLALFFVLGRPQQTTIEAKNQPVVSETFIPVNADITDLSGAGQWTQETIETTKVVSLRSGVVGFHVEHVKPNARFIVKLPDGELEVRGTRFIVDVKGEQTRSVTVSEGIVELRLKDYSGRLIAGQQWSEGPSATVAISASAIESSSPPIVTPSAQAVAQGNTATTGSVEQHEPAVPSASAAKTTKVIAGERFAEAMNTFSAGRYAEAERLFVKFIIDFPGDSRAEDAAFLRAEARKRTGDTAGAAAIASTYLQTYPGGLRRNEAEKLVSPPAAGSSK